MNDAMFGLVIIAAMVNVVAAIIGFKRARKESKYGFRASVAGAVCLFVWLVYVVAGYPTSIDFKAVQPNPARYTAALVSMTVLFGAVFTWCWTMFFKFFNKWVKGYALKVPNSE